MAMPRVPLRGRFYLKQPALMALDGATFHGGVSEVDPILVFFALGAPRNLNRAAIF
jgi:hypothetical protein